MESVSTWRAAATQTRETAKWVIVSLTAAAAAIFGGAPIVKSPTLSWEEDRMQLVIALVLGVAGLLGMVKLIRITAAVLVPGRVTLATVPASFVNELDEGQDVLLPQASPHSPAFGAACGRVNSACTDWNVHRKPSLSTWVEAPAP